MSEIKLGTAEIERLICDPASLGSLELLMPRVQDAWSSVFPDLGDLPRFGGESRKLRMCIATEDIVGPVRNGGIGTTYTALAEVLADIGFDTTILYLRGHEVENGTIEEWVAHYRQRNIRFVPVPNYAAADRFQTGADRWLRAPYNLLRFLLENPMDVVHVSEWRGAAYLSLLAKRQGLAFAATLFIVKTSSPWLWNRIYGSQPLDRLEDLSKIQAERFSVESADMVIGGSLHLLKWMASQGYQVPRQRTFVQPNVIHFDHLRHLTANRAASGTRIEIDEFVFFGRLESRKGLLIFCHAIKRLIRLGVGLPDTITFLGKPGARLTARPDQDISDFIESETENWPSKVQILPDCQQVEALQYLLGGSRLAVMPSMIENSSLAVYEAAICGIPFVASDSGGTPELVHEDDRAFVLCNAHPVPLSALLQKALKDGAYIARPSFDNEQNLETWRRFHLDLGRGLLEHLLGKPREASAEAAPSVATCIYFSGDTEQLTTTLTSLAVQEHKSDEVIIVVDGPDDGLLAAAEQVAKAHGIACKIVDGFDLDAGLAFNKGAATAESDYVLFVWAGVSLQPNALRALLKVAASSDADLVNFFYRVVSTHAGKPVDFLKAHIIGSVTEEFFRTDLEPIPLMIRSESFRLVGGFSSDYRIVGHDHEFIAKALVTSLKCETVLLELGTVPALDETWLYRECYDRSTSYFRAIRPQIAAVPLAIRELLLMSKGLQGKPVHRLKAPSSKRVPDRKASRKPSYIDKIVGSFFAGDEEVPVMPPTPPRSATAERPGPRQEKLAGKLIGTADTPSHEPSAKPGHGSDQDTLMKFPRKAPAVNWRFASSSVLGVHKGKIYGVARDEEQDGKIVDVCLMDGETVIKRQAASVAIPVIYKNTGGKHGFVFNLRALPQVHKRVLPWKLKVCEAQSRALIGSVLIPGLDRRLGSFGLQGYCDIVEGAVVRGWIWAPEEPKRTLDVAVFVDGIFLTRIAASVKRNDLEAAGIGHGNYGFNVPLPKVLRTGKVHDVDVVVARLGLTLTRGRLRLEGDRLSYR